MGYSTKIFSTTPISSQHRHLEESMHSPSEKVNSKVSCRMLPPFGSCARWTSLSFLRAAAFCSSSERV